MHIHEYCLSVHTTRAACFSVKVFHQNGKLSCLSTFQSPDWLTSCLGTMAFGCLHRAPSKCWVSVVMCGQRLQHALERRILTYSSIDRNNLKLPLGVALLPPAPSLWPTLETLFIFIGSSWQAPPLYLPLCPWELVQHQVLNLFSLHSQLSLTKWGWRGHAPLDLSGSHRIMLMKVCFV